ncbi:MAG: TIGR03000 domain-containing protein [Planctomycetes bacterium]|nr:TIGR03000 domain-containing protein [Planctomycetota bacterium]
MYSIVMLTAMSAGADVTPPPKPATPVVVSPVGCGGCSGIVMSGCTGCSGYTSCHGCCGGFLGLRSGGLFHRSSCHGCTGCTGFSCSGYACHGSCSGSCFGSCHGSAWGPPVGMPPYTLHGYNTGTATWTAGAPVTIYGRTHSPNPPPVMVIPMIPPAKTGSDAPPVGANLIFKVPADAKVYVDGKKDPEPGAGTTRAFYTPALATGKKFFYEVEVKVKVKDKEESEKQTVVFESGETKTVEFKKLVAAVEKAGAVAGK